MSIRSNFIVPPSSLHRLKLPKDQRNAVRSASDSDKEAALMTIIHKVIQQFQLQILQSEIQQINGFRILFSCYQTSGTALMGKQLEGQNPDISFLRSQVDYIIFFIRALPGQKPDIYAATRGGNMPRKMKNLTDYKFPWKVAKRHLSPTLLELKTRHLIGPVLQSSLTFYGMPSFSLLQLQSQFVTHFTTKFRERSAICCQIEGHDQKRAMTVDVNMKSIRINSQLGLPDYSNILIHLSKLHQHEETFECPHSSSTQDRIAEKDDESFFFLDLVVRAPIQTRQELESCLIERLWKTYDQPKTPSDIRFWHRYSDDYLRSWKFVLRYGEKIVEDWTSPPSLLEVVLAIKFFKRIDSLEVFYQEVAKLSMEFQLSGQPCREGLLSFLEAEIRTAEGKIYFRNHGIWLEVSSEYLMLVQSDFRANINSCLIPRSSPAQLHIPWMSQPSWAAVTWKELEEKIKEVTQVQQEIKVVWNKLKLIAEPLKEKGNLKRKREGPSPTEKKRRVTEQTSITAHFQKQPTSQPASLPAADESFIVAKKPEGFSQPLQSFLEEKHQLYCDVKNEWDYNALYIGEPSFFVGDHITPNGVELFDLMKEVGDTLYLYQVKKSISEVTTKACSQLRNAAEALSGTLLNPSASSNILRKFWDIVTSGKNVPYFRELKAFYQRYGCEKFISLFNRDRKNICFVLAFHDDRTKEAKIEEEGRLETVLSSKDFDQLSSENSGAQIYQKLLEQGYINTKGQPSLSLERLKKRHFDLGKEISPSLTTRIFYKIYHKITAFQSTLAKVDITLTRKTIEDLGFSFRICQIYRPQNASDAIGDEAETEWKLFSQPPSNNKVELCTINERNYTTLSTPPDGSCGLHALRGEVSNRACRITSGVPKRDFVNKIREELDLDNDEHLIECQVDLLENALGLDPSKEAKLAYPPALFKPFQEQYRPAEKQESIRRQQLQKEEGGKWANLINGNPEAKKLVMKHVFPEKNPHFQSVDAKDIEKLMPWINGARNTIEKFFSASQLSEIRRLHQQRLNNSTTRELKRTFVSQPEVREAYFTALQNDSYYLSTQELILAARLYNIRCRVYVKRRGADELVAEYPGGQGDEVLIFHHSPFSLHFSRLGLAAPTQHQAS